MTTVGYGDVSPLTMNERMYAMLAMGISAGVFAYTIGNIGQMVSRFNLLAAQYRAKMTYVRRRALSACR